MFSDSGFLVMKKCIKCHKNKPLNKFPLNKNLKDGYNSVCKECHRKYVAEYYKLNPRKQKNCNLRKYGITVEEYDQLFEKQNGVCAVCRKPETRICTKKIIQSLSVDHDHYTGIVRGLLCDRCNKAIGLLYHDVDLLKRIIKYLKVT